MRRDVIIATVVAGVAGAGAAALLRRRREPGGEARRVGAGTPAHNGRGPDGALLERRGPAGDPSRDGLAPASDDAVLADRVRSELGRHPLGAHVNVNVEFGVVVLRGEVPGDDDIVALGAAAEGVEGVIRVDNRLHRHATPPPLGDSPG